MAAQYKPKESATATVPCKTYSAEPICTPGDAQLSRKIKFPYIFTIKRRRETAAC